MITESKTRQIEPDTTVVEISGRLGHGNLLLSIENSLKRLIEEGAKKLIIDLSHLDYIDSAGIGVLIASVGLAEKKGAKLRISGARGAVAESFEIVHMNRIAALEPDLDSACRNLA